jgi:hypothetical protein
MPMTEAYIKIDTYFLKNIERLREKKKADIYASMKLEPV